MSWSLSRVFAIAGFQCTGADEREVDEVVDGGSVERVNADDELLNASEHAVGTRFGNRRRALGVVH